MQSEGPLLKQSQSSLSLQVFIHFNWHFIVFFFFLNLALFAYKGTCNRLAVSVTGACLVVAGTPFVRSCHSDFIFHVLCQFPAYNPPNHSLTVLLFNPYHNAPTLRLRIPCHSPVSFSRVSCHVPRFILLLHVSLPYVSCSGQVFLPRILPRLGHHYRCPLPRYRKHTLAPCVES